MLNRKRRENSRDSETVNRLLAEAHYNTQNSLINQATLIGHAYLTLVWLWEKQPVNFIDVIPDTPLESGIAPWPVLSQTVILWEEGRQQPSAQTLRAWLRHVRNALSHGRVSFSPLDEDTLVFADAAPGSSEPHTLISIPPRLLSTVADIMVDVCARRVA